MTRRAPGRVVLTAGAAAGIAAAYLCAHACFAQVRPRAKYRVLTLVQG